MAVYELIIGTGLLSEKLQTSPFGQTPVVFCDNGKMFRDFLQESRDMFIVIWSPRVRTIWENYLEKYPDVKECIQYEMPYAVSNALHLTDHTWTSGEAQSLNLTDSRRTKLIILKGKRHEG
jgi:hypothetical protein